MVSGSNSLVDSPTDPLQHKNFFQRLSNDCLLLIIKEVSLPNSNYYPGDTWPLKSLSLVSQQLRQLCIPHLFRKSHLELRQNHSSAVEHYKAFVKAPFLSSKLVSLQLWIRRMHHESSTPPADLGHSLVAALVAMPKLEALSLNLENDESRTSNIRTAFRASKTTLPNVKVLEALQVPNAAFLLRACPSSEKFTTLYPNKQWKKTFEAVAVMPNIQAVWMTNHKGWKSAHFQEVLPYVQNVPELCLRGDMYRSKLSTLAPLFSKMSNLTSLFISSEQWVNYAYLSKRYFDDRYLDAIDDLKENSPYNEDLAVVAQAFFKASRSITTFRVIFFSFADVFRVVREEDGSFNGMSKGEQEKMPDFPHEFLH